MTRKLHKLLPLLGLLLVCPAQTSVGANISAEAVKALYIVQMQKFITLGNPGHKPEKFCYYEKQPLTASESVGQQIERYMASKAGSEQTMTVKRFNAVGNFTGCDMLYIPAEDADDINNILVSLGNASTITLSSAPRFILRGGMLGFTLDNENRVKMEVNVKNMNPKQVAMDAQLLELMTNIMR